MSTLLTPISSISQVLAMNTLLSPEFKLILQFESLNKGLGNKFLLSPSIPPLLWTFSENLGFLVGQRHR